jgi:hypothetical protein
MAAFVTGLAISPSALPAQNLVLKPLVIRDPATANQPAVHALVPAGWRTEGGVIWRPEMANIATVDFRAWSPYGRESVDVMPIETFVWNKGGIAGFPNGSVYLGRRVLPATGDAATFIQDIAPQLRPRLRHASVVQVGVLPAAAKAVESTISGASATRWARAARVRFEYREAGSVMQEDVYCALLFVISPSAPTTIYWQPERFYSFRAVKGQLDSAAPMLHTIAASLRYDPTWFNRYYRVGLRQRQAAIKLVHAPGTLASYLSGFSDAPTPAAREAYQRRLTADVTIMRGFGERVHGLELYRGSAGAPQIQLPAGYDQAWRATSGAYILSRDAGFRPRHVPGGAWARLERLDKPIARSKASHQSSLESSG